MYSGLANSVALLNGFAGDLRVAGMWPYYYEASYLLYAEAAKNLINQGFWSREFVGEEVLGYMFEQVQSGSCVRLHLSSRWRKDLSRAALQPQDSISGRDITKLRHNPNSKY